MSQSDLPDSIIDRLFYHAQNAPNHDAIVTTTYTLSYQDLVNLVLKQVKEFYRLDISSDSIVGIQCADNSKHLIATLSLIYIGATSCTIPSYENELAQKHILRKCSASHIVDEESLIDTLALIDVISLEEQPLKASKATLLFSTSGTSGEPKLVIHDDHSITEQAYRHINSDNERFLCVASMEHNFAKRHRLYCLAMGATNIFIDSSNDNLVSQCHSLHINVLHVSAFQAQELLAKPDISTLSSIRLKLGGSHVPLKLRQQLKHSITLNLQAGYGTTETGAISFTDPEDLNSGESVGKVLSGIDIAIVSPKRERLDNNESGEIAIRCAGMFKGYLNNTKLSDTLLSNEWFYTGDIGYLDDQQRIHLNGRSDDMFIFNSMNIYPQDIESQICQFPSVVDALVLPKKSSVHGNIPVALVVFSKDVIPQLSALKKFVQSNIGVRSPKSYTIVDRIPRNKTGKLVRQKKHNLSNNSDAIRATIIQSLSESKSLLHIKKAIVSGFLNGENDITTHKIKMDSLARMELMVVLEVKHGVIIMPTTYSKLTSLEDIVLYVLNAISINKILGSSEHHQTTSNILKTNQKYLPYIIKLFKRAFSFCHTVAQLNKILDGFENKATPSEVLTLIEYQAENKLIPLLTDNNYKSALDIWCHRIKTMMIASEKSIPEPFKSFKIKPTVTHFIGTGSTRDKNLIICFSPLGYKRLMMPSSVLLQHFDASQHDILIISEPLAKSYQQGVPFLGNSIFQVAQGIKKLDLIQNYKDIKTLGASAGGYAAVIVGNLLNAKLSVCVGGRFPSERYLKTIINKIFLTWRSKQIGHCSKIIFTYSLNKRRDLRYSRLMAKICRGHLLGVLITGEKLGHNVLERLAYRGELNLFLKHTLFSDNDIQQAKLSDNILNLPSAKFSVYKK